MSEKAILIVDDEPNIRLTLARALEGFAPQILTAVNGEDALRIMAEHEVGVVLLDLKMPGMDGMEALRRIAHDSPATRVVIITAHGSVPNAVEAMKLGAADFLQKPFSPDEVRTVVRDVLARDLVDPEEGASYGEVLARARRAINDREFEVAEVQARRAIGMQASHPDAFNLLGAILEVRGDRLGAQKMYRVALDLDPTHRAAAANLERTARSSWGTTGRHGPTLD